jgi:hypothetical protein
VVALVLFVVELEVVVPAEGYSPLQALQTLQDRAFVVARFLASISEGGEAEVPEGLESFLGGAALAHHQESCHQERRVRLLLVVGRAVVEDSYASVTLFPHYSPKLSTETMNLRQAQRTKVFVVASVYQDLKPMLTALSTSSMLKKNESDMFLGGNLLQYQYSLSIKV